MNYKGINCLKRHKREVLQQQQQAQQGTTRKIRKNDADKVLQKLKTKLSICQQKPTNN